MCLIYTGPDTAIRVVIQDTLSRFLDPASVRPGASSHDYCMEVYACGILKFTFENILLPSSSTDPQASQLFVKYRLSQRPGNPAEAIVDNSAAIYFDYKAPIKTDSIYHTITETCTFQDNVSISSQGIYLQEVEKVNVFPNPAHEQMTVQIITEANLEDTELVLFDRLGREVRRESFEGKQFVFYTEDMASGLYFYKILTAGQSLSVGKVVFY